MANHHLTFNKQFFSDFWGLLKPYWRSDEKWIAWGLFSLYVVCILGEIGASVGFNHFHKIFFNALQAVDKAGIIAALCDYLVIVFFYVLSLVGVFYFHGLLSARWRLWLTKNYLQKWLHNHAHYRMQVLNKSVDNPDQRISEDLEKFPMATLSLFQKFSHSLLMLLSFGYILWGLSGTYLFPGIFCWAAFFYAMVGTWGMTLIGKRLASLDYQQQQYNADFRFGLARLRETSEQVAVFRGESVENEKFHGLFSRVFKNTMKIISLETRLKLFSKGYDFLAYPIGLVISMPLFLAKTITWGIVMQISSAFNTVNSAFSVFIEAFNDLADWRSVIHRLAEFNGSIDHQYPTKISIKDHDNGDIVIKDLHLTLPDGKSLLKETHFTLKQGQTILIKGLSGVGKSTLLRAIAGLWPHGEGQVHLPRDSKRLFLPQKPYLPIGSLKEALHYPCANIYSDDEYHQVLKMCGLEKFKDQLDHPRHLSHELSLGEQQLIGFGRILLYKPDVIFLDEATSALDEESELKMHKMLRDHLPKATIVSVGHRNHPYDYSMDLTCVPL